MRKPDEIMAEYLLKGGKMLAKTCPDCNSPLFEYKGETFCVVCREEQRDQQKDDKPERQDENVVPPPSLEKRNGLYSGNMEESLDDVFTQTIRELLIQARGEQDTRRLKDLMKAIRIAAEASSILHYGYERRERS
jgi:UPF0148 protein